jgi:hypothetical protein
MTETKTEARERMSDEAVDEAWREPDGDDDLTRLWQDHLRARASEASLSAALSALRAEHQRVQEQAAAMRDALTKLQERVREMNVTGSSYYPGSLDDRVSAALTPDAGRGWVSPEEHQRVVAESSKLRGEFLRHEMHIIGATKERDEARAALAASEEKARGMGEALKRARTFVCVTLCPPLGEGRGVEHAEECRSLLAALSSSPAPGAAPACSHIEHYVCPRCAAPKQLISEES